MKHPTNVLELGQIIVDQLDKEASRDVLAAWISHHIAELIHLAKTSNNPQEKQEAENRALTAILLVWEKRRCIPGEIDPIKKYQSVIDVMESYGNENEPFWDRKQLNEPSQSKCDLLNNIKKIVIGTLIVDKINTYPLTEELKLTISQFLEPEENTLIKFFTAMENQLNSYDEKNQSEEVVTDQAKTSKKLNELIEETIRTLEEMKIK